MGKGHDCTLKEGPRPFDPPTATLEDAVTKLTESVAPWWRLIEGRQQRSRLHCALVLCDLSVGKTRANLLEAGAYLRRHDPRRVVYIVPNLRLGREIVERFKALYPAVPVQLYLGND